MRLHIWWLGLILFLSVTSGCAAMITTVVYPFPFSGVIIDSAILVSQGEFLFPQTTYGDYFFRYLFMVVAGIDWLPSLAGDLVLFPWKLFAAVFFNINPVG